MEDEIDKTATSVCGILLFKEMKESRTVSGEIYVGVDLMKLICALLIVFMHTYNHDWGVVGEWIHTTLTPIGVPFFFIVSGFLYGKGLKKTMASKEYFSHYIKRIIYMYVFWTMVTLPVAWMNLEIAHADYSVGLKLLYIVRCFFLTGSIGIYWYLLALIYNSVLIYYAVKWRKESLLYMLALVFFVVGVLYDGGLLKGTAVGNVIHVSVGSERNFLNVGLFYMSIGFLFAQKRFTFPAMVTPVILALLLVAATWYNSVSPFRVMQAPLAVLLFMIAMQHAYKYLLPYSLAIRKWSTAIYLGHFPLILWFDYYLVRGTILDFSLVLIVSLVLFYMLSSICPQRLLKVIYG